MLVTVIRRYRSSIVGPLTPRSQRPTVHGWTPRSLATLRCQHSPYSALPRAAMICTSTGSMGRCLVVEGLRRCQIFTRNCCNVEVGSLVPSAYGSRGLLDHLVGEGKQLIRHIQ